jgi:hypothetical protein
MAVMPSVSASRCAEVAGAGPQAATKRAEQASDNVSEVFMGGVSFVGRCAPRGETFGRSENFFLARPNVET